MFNRKKVDVWGKEKCCGNMSHRQVSPQLVQVLERYTENVFYFFIKHRNEKGEQLVSLIIKM